MLIHIINFCKEFCAMSNVATTKKNFKKLNLLNRHKHFMTVLGALIVFCTFVVKDAMRDQLRDVAASVDSAAETFAAIERTDRILQDLTTMVRMIFVIADYQKGLRGNSTGAENAENDRSFGSTFSRLDQTARLLDASERVRDVVAFDSKHLEQLKRLQAEQREYKTMLDGLMDDWLEGGADKNT